MILDEIDDQVWQGALRETRRRPGMGSIRLDYNPYTGGWRCEINYADDQRFPAEHVDVNAAIFGATVAVIAGYRRDADAGAATTPGAGEES